MYNANAAVAGATAGSGSMLAMTGSDSLWLIAAGVALIVGGFLIARAAGRRSTAA